MDIALRAAESMLLMTVLFAAALGLRGTGVLLEEHARIFAKAITQLILPALVFGHLAVHRITAEMLEAPALMLSSCIALMVLGYAAGRWLFRLPRPSLGALILCTGFTSAAFLGIALVEIVYPNDHNMEETVLIAELGVGMPVFILGPLIAAYFGARKEGEGFDLIRGLLWLLSLADLHRDRRRFGVGRVAASYRGESAAGRFLGACKRLEGGLVPVVGLAVGLMLRPLPIATLAPLIAFVALAQLLLQPLYLFSRRRSPRP